MLRVGVPAGVGDVYWCLTKLKAFARGEPVKLMVQASHYDRACEWAQMVDFVDSAEVWPFRCEPAMRTGWHGPWKILDAVLWPNAVIDRGERIETWLPELPCDLDFEVRCPEVSPRVVVYASSLASARWTGSRGDYWDKVIRRLTELVGPVTLVGAHWDRDLAEEITVPHENLIGRTSLPQLAGIVKSARVVCGVISGLTILANHFRTPVATVWHDQRFPAGFPTAWVAADAPYQAIPASNCSAGTLARAAVQLAR